MIEKEQAIEKKNGELKDEGTKGTLHVKEK
jgi:hypothetical protein